MSSLHLLWELTQNEVPGGNNSKLNPLVSETPREGDKSNRISHLNAHVMAYEKQVARRLHGVALYNRSLKETSVLKPSIISKEKNINIKKTTQPSVMLESTEVPQKNLHGIKLQPVVASIASQSPRDITATTATQLAPYEGDYFGTRGIYLDGLLYRCRMKKSNQLPPDKKVKKTKNRRKSSDIRFQNYDELSKVTTKDNSPLEAIRRYARTLTNWSMYPQNALLLVQEGALEAIIQQCTTKDTEVRTSCASALAHLSQQETLRSAMLESGVVKTIVKLISEETFPELHENCAKTLCHLSCQFGSEGRLVEDGAVSALTYLLNGNDELAPLCGATLFNLSAVSETYPKVGKVIKAFVSLASSSAKRKLHYSTAFYQLACVESIRPILVEEGIVAVLKLLVRGSRYKVIYNVAFIGYLLSKNNGALCQEVVSKGIITIFGTASKSRNVPTWEVVASAMLNFCSVESSRLRIVSDGGLLLLFRILREYSSTVAVKYTCTLAVHKLSCTSENQQRIVEIGGVELLSTLSKNENVQLSQAATLAMCTLLSVPRASAEIITFGAVKSLADLTTTSDASTQYACALALYNLSRTSLSASAILEQPVISALLRLCPSPHVGTRLYCVAALYYLASTHNEVKVAMIHFPGVIKSLVGVLQGSVQTALVRYTITALCILADDEVCTEALLKEECIPLLLTAARGSDLKTKFSVCSLLVSMTSRQHCRQQFLHVNDVLTTLIELTTLKNEQMQKQCAAAIANLSFEPQLCLQMIDLGIVSVLASISNSYSEDNQRFVAQTLCNLSLLDGLENQLVAQGSVELLLMIALVRAVALDTKEYCATALGNLLVPDTLQAIIAAGLIPALCTLTTMDSKNINAACTSTYYLLVTTAMGREALCSTPRSIRSLIPLLEHPEHVDEETQKLIAVILCHLTEFDDSVHIALENGIVEALALLFTYQSATEETEKLEKLVHVYLKLSSTADTAMLLLQHGAGKTILQIVHVCVQQQLPLLQNALFILENCCAQASCMAYLTIEDTVPPILDLLRDSAHASCISDTTRTACMSILCFISAGCSENKTILIQLGIVQALHTSAHSNLEDVSIIEKSTLLMRALSDTLVDVTVDNYIQLVDILCTLVSLLSDSKFEGTIDKEGTEKNCAEALCNIAFAARDKSMLITEV